MDDATLAPVPIPPKRKNKLEWPAEQIATLTELWATGKRAAEIAAIMKISKNAVLGKVHRLKLPSRPDPIIRKTPRISAPKPARPRPSAPSAPKKPAPAPRAPGRVPANSTPVPSEFKPLDGIGVLFGTAKNSQCAAPLWDDSTPRDQRRVCGLPVGTQGAYCTHHRARFYTRPAYPSVNIRQTDFSLKHLNPKRT